MATRWQHDLNQTAGLLTPENTHTERGQYIGTKAFKNNLKIIICRLLGFGVSCFQFPFPLPLARFSGISRTHTRLMRAIFLHGDMVASVVVVLIRCEITVPYCLDSEPKHMATWSVMVTFRVGFPELNSTIAQGLPEVCTHSLQNIYSISPSLNCNACDLWREILGQLVCPGELN